MLIIMVWPSRNKRWSFLIVVLQITSRSSFVFRFDKARLLDHAAAQLSFLLVLVPIQAIGQSPTHKKILFACAFYSYESKLQVDPDLLPMSGHLSVFFFTNLSVVYYYGIVGMLENWQGIACWRWSWVDLYYVLDFVLVSLDNVCKWLLISKWHLVEND